MTRAPARTPRRRSRLRAVLIAVVALFATLGLSTSASAADTPTYGGHVSCSFKGEVEATLHLESGSGISGAPDVPVDVYVDGVKAGHKVWVISSNQFVSLYPVKAQPGQTVRIEASTIAQEFQQVVKACPDLSKTTVEYSCVQDGHFTLTYSFPEAFGGTVEFTSDDGKIDKMWLYDTDGPFKESRTFEIQPAAVLKFFAHDVSPGDKDTYVYEKAVVACAAPNPPPTAPAPNPAPTTPVTSKVAPAGVKVPSAARTGITGPAAPTDSPAPVLAGGVALAALLVLGGVGGRRLVRGHRRTR